jgi:hypothetical protein
MFAFKIGIESSHVFHITVYTSVSSSLLLLAGGTDSYHWTLNS